MKGFVYEAYSLLDESWYENITLRSYLKKSERAPYADTVVFREDRTNHVIKKVPVSQLSKKDLSTKCKSVGTSLTNENEIDAVVRDDTYLSKPEHFLFDVYGEHYLPKVKKYDTCEDRMSAFLKDWIYRSSEGDWKQFSKDLEENGLQEDSIAFQKQYSKYLG